MSLQSFVLVPGKLTHSSASNYYLADRVVKRVRQPVFRAAIHAAPALEQMTAVGPHMVFCVVVELIN